MLRQLALALAFAALPATAGAQPRHPALAGLDAAYPELDALYRDLHQNPELSRQEKRTAAVLADELRRRGFEVTEKVGGHGVVGVLKNGAGPVLMLRADMDALPVEEKTGLPYASKVIATDDRGARVPVMHACGHDVHMTSVTGAAGLLAQQRARWRGTLVVVFQPAEERGGGARGMLADGLFTRFPRPAHAIALHDSASLPSGRIGYTSGHALASVDSLDIEVVGRGGHGAYPHTTVDPIVIAARIVVALQTIVARENDPLEPAVVTVGSIHGGTKHNVIPDRVDLQLTVRTYKGEVRARVLAAIERIAAAEAAAAGAPRPPRITRVSDTRATYNDPALTKRVAAALTAAFGDAVGPVPPVMGGEDFSEYGRAGVPSLIFWIGAVEPKAHAAATKAGKPLPSLHSSTFAPDRERTIRTGVAALTVAALDLLGAR